MFDLNPAGDVQRDVVGQQDAFRVSFSLQDRDFCLEIRRLDVGNQPPFEPASQAFLEFADLMRRAVRAEHDLLSARRAAR
jgi:hypothetical protein